MSLANRILRFLGLSLVVQIFVLGVLGYYVLNNKDQSLPPSIVQSLTNVDQKILEGVAFQHKVNNETARNLIAYELLELNRVDDVEFLQIDSLRSLIHRLELKCREVEGFIKLCVKPSKKYVVSFVPVKIQNNVVGYLKLGKSLNSALVTSKDIFIVVVTIITSFVLNLSFIFGFWLFYLKPELQKLILVIRSGVPDDSIRSLEYIEIQKKIVENYKRIGEAEKERISLEKAEEREQIFKQVAHDVRSPLTSLEYFVRNSLVKLAENERLIVKQSIERIIDILSTLGGRKDAIRDIEKCEVMDALLKRIVSEKRVEFEMQRNVQIDFVNNLPYGVFVKICKPDFYRVMSNLINNSVESVVPTKKNEIVITTNLNNERCFISIRDNGKGISEDRLAKVFDYGVSFDKPNGTGIGLSYAKDTVSKYGGDLRIQSKEGEGTIVSISLPIVSPPRWFKPSLAIQSKNICIIDDDQSIHSIWDEILARFDMNIVHLNSYDQFREWLTKINSDDYMFLFDLELISSEVDGIEIIKQYNLNDRSTLVTSHYDDDDVQRRAEALGVKIIPKEAAANIKIELVSKRTETVVLIDDDKIMHFHWSLYCQKNGVSFKGFKTVDEFLEESFSFDKDVKIYIDSNLGDGLKGDIESERIYLQGFSNLFLATGYHADDIEKPSWIKKIFSKDPACIWS
ncbi:MAG: hybrid sensor histidine kinase/response regulator [Bacteriovoracaceae bacterium]